MINLSTRNLNISRNIKSEGSLVRKRAIVDYSNLSASPRLINWVEPVIIAGYEKTIIYTEIDSNLKKGDRVFIINGNYDSDLLIDADRYKRGRDGYKILDIDRCKITLDLDYTGDLPWIEDDYDNFIKVHHVRNQREFDYVNDQYIARDSFANKFEIGQNNIIFVDGAYNGKPPASLLTDLGDNGGVTQSGFYVRDTSSPANWVNITNDFLSNNLTSYLSTNFSNNGRVIVINENFTYGSKEFREDDIYFYKTSTNTWEIDPQYMRPFITKSNFRRGNFKGKWNKGVYGSYDEKINWEGVDSAWNNGTVINTEWKSGAINSIFIPEKSYFAEFDEFGLPVQKDNIVNNRGFGYSYFINMDFTKSVINNGNFIHCNVGLASSTYSVADKYYQNLSVDVSNKINKGDFTSCDFESSYVYNSVVKNSRTNNSYFENVKSINSYFTDAVFYKSNYNSDNIIKIQAYDEWNAHLNGNSSNTKYKIYKFYISESDYSRMKSLDKFFIKGLKLNSEDYWTLKYNKILNFFDRGFILDSYSDYEDVETTTGFTKKSIDFTCKLSSKAENTYKLSAYLTGITYVTGTYSLNDIQLPSIDVTVRIEPYLSYIGGFFSTTNDYNYTFESLPIGGTLSYIGNNINISDAYIVDSYFNSGLFERSNWNSGDLYNYNSDTKIDGNPNYGSYSISVVSSTQLSTTLPIDTTRLKDEYYKAGDVVYLNAIDYNNGNSVTRLTNIWKIDTIFPFRLSEYLIGTTSTIVSSLTGSGIFLTSPDGLTSSIIGTNRYNYLHKVRINNSTIKSGIIRRAFISNSTIYSDTFDNSDYLFNDKIKLKSLVIMDSIFSKNGNSIKSGLISTSYINRIGNINNDVWYNGVFWRSLWEGANFNNGSFVESNWKNGSFNNGIFYQNKTSIYNNLFFDNSESSYYKSSGNIPFAMINDRFTWENGTFYNGQFFESVWERGSFKGGKIYKSTWTDGIFYDGIFGDDKFNVTDNNFYGGTFSGGVVINSNFYSGGTYSTGFTGINWQNGIFQSGIFGNNVNDPQATATWASGTFNGGNFTNTAVWLNGTFNGGKLTSYYGATYTISNNQSEYTWQNGVFNGGEFGTADGLTNSNWWNGEMHGGIFKGKVWNNGILVSGEFQGGSTWSSVGPVTNLKSLIEYCPSTSFTSNVFSSVGSFIIDAESDDRFGRVFQSGGYILYYRTLNMVPLTIYNTTPANLTPGSKYLITITVDYAYGETDPVGLVVFLGSASTYSPIEGEDNMLIVTPTSYFTSGPYIYSYNGTFTGVVTCTEDIINIRAFYDGAGPQAGSLAISYLSIVEYLDDPYQSNSISFVDSFTHSYYGLWRDGFVTETKDKFIKNKELLTTVERSSNNIKFSELVNRKRATMKNALWVTGTFSHRSGQMNNCVWLDGTFEQGTFNNSSFNPYVRRLDSSNKFGLTNSFNINDDTCVWKNGVFSGGDFNISKWNDGLFTLGTANGMIWQNGTSNYMNAFNVFWENGLWRNGNWYGSSFEFDGSVTDDYTRQILFRGMSWSGTSSCHIWNIFEDPSSNTLVIDATPGSPVNPPTYVAPEETEL